MQPAKPDLNSNSPYTWLILQKTKAQQPQSRQQQILQSRQPLLTFPLQLQLHPALRNAVVTKVAAAVETVAASAAVVVVDADAAAHAVKNAQLLPMPMATSFPKKWSSSTDAQQLRRADAVSVSQPSWFAETRKAKSA